MFSRFFVLNLNWAGFLNVNNETLFQAQTDAGSWTCKVRPQTGMLANERLVWDRQQLLSSLISASSPRLLQEFNGWSSGLLFVFKDELMLLLLIYSGRWGAQNRKKDLSEGYYTAVKSIHLCWLDLTDLIISKWNENTHDRRQSLSISCVCARSFCLVLRSVCVWDHDGGLLACQNTPLHASGHYCLSSQTSLLVCPKNTAPLPGPLSPCPAPRGPLVWDVTSIQPHCRPRSLSWSLSRCLKTNICWL